MSFDIPLTPNSRLPRGTPPIKLDLPALVPLDEPPTNGITIQPPTAILDDIRPDPVNVTNGVTKPALDRIPSAGSPLHPSPRGSAGTARISPSSRYPLTRTLSPDLPTRDALYLFSNFSSYMRSPNEGPGGILSNDDFKDTVRLLDFARTLVERPNSNVHVLHLKYRFQSPLDAQQSTYSAGDRQLPVNHIDAMGRLRNPVPQPFSVARDPVLKIDYQENGVFTPLPAQAIFNHISKACYPPPRIIVASFVNSYVTQNHIAQLSTWALTSSPPCYIFSPLETRLRGYHHPIQYTLNHAIPMSMYAQPNPEASSPYRPSPTRSTGGGDIIRKSVSPTTRRRRHSDNSLPEPSHELRSPRDRERERSYPPDPVASLTIVSTPVPSGPQGEVEVPPTASTSCSTAKGYLQSDRIPLWALAPGMNVLQGSTSASIGIKLSDFSALNLIDASAPSAPGIGATRIGGHGRMASKSGLNKTVRAHHSGAGEVWIDSSPIQAKHKILVPPVEPVGRPSTPATKVVEIDNTSNRHTSSTRHRVIEIDNKSSRHGGHHDLEPRSIHSGAHFVLPKEMRHLTPPEKFTPPELFTSRSTAGAFPRLARIPHWKRGVKELTEDVLEEMGKGLEVDGVLEGMRDLGLWDMEIGLHDDRIRRASEVADGSLLQNLGRTGR